MKVLLLNQTFYPDVASTAQHLKDFALRLAERGHAVTVVTSQTAYDNPALRFPRREIWRGIKIQRVACSRFGKAAKWRRAADFASFSIACGLRALALPRHDAVVALTSPPLISVLGAWLAGWKRTRFFYWVMDLNPDEAIAAGWLREESLASRVLQWMSRYSFRSAKKIIALDKFMRARIEAKGIAPDKIAVIPPWSHDDAVRFDGEGREAFRRAHELSDKFVVMYSGNHSPCHPLDTLLEAARRLAHRKDIVFCFVGGGSEWRRIKEKAESGKGARDHETTDHGTTDQTDPNASPLPASCSLLPNVLCLPYQPLSQLSGSLSAADLHAVVMGEAFVGIIHPCKIYNALAVGAPVLCIGPETSHLSEVLDALKSGVCGSVRHGDVDRCVIEIQRMASQRLRGEPERYTAVARRFSQRVLLPQLVAELERGTDAGGTSYTSPQSFENR